jgi:hypothetical protein
MIFSVNPVGGCTSDSALCPAVTISNEVQGAFVDWRYEDNVCVCFGIMVSHSRA